VGYFKKRGLSSQGFVANGVETVQIVDAGIDWATGQPLWLAMVQVGALRQKTGSVRYLLFF
jgi:hypothetical protein